MQQSHLCPQLHLDSRIMLCFFSAPLPSFPLVALHKISMLSNRKLCFYFIFIIYPLLRLEENTNYCQGWRHFDPLKLFPDTQQQLRVLQLESVDDGERQWGNNCSVFISSQNPFFHLISKLMQQLHLFMGYIANAGCISFCLLKLHLKAKIKKKKINNVQNLFKDNLNPKIPEGETKSL